MGLDAWMYMCIEDKASMLVKDMTSGRTVDGDLLVFAMVSGELGMRGRGVSMDAN